MNDGRASRPDPLSPAPSPPPGLRTPRRESPYERIKTAIVDGELAPGQPLVEAALAEWCQVSRTPIREALTRLEQDGLVRRTERGLVVRESSPEEILDIYETRIALEATAARVAADRRSSHDVMYLRRAQERMRAMSTDDPPAMAASNRDFHRLVWRASRNESLIDLLERLNLHLGRYPETTLTYPGRWVVSLDEHDRLVDAIEARDAQRAHDVATAHFTAARDIRLKLSGDE